MKLSSASVKVMRSYDYCHFEIVLGTDVEDVSQVDCLRKEAARLADKAVEQYKIAKENAENVATARRRVGYLQSEVERIRALSETDRSVEDKAVLKSYEDEMYRANHEYNYDDDWD